MKIYCVVKGKLVSRASDNKRIAWAFDNKHAKQIAKKFDRWHNMGWPIKDWY